VHILVGNPLSQVASNALKDLSQQAKSLDRDPELHAPIAVAYGLRPTAPEPDP